MSKRMATSLFLERETHLCCALYKAARPWVSIGALNTTGLRKESIISQISLPMCDNANWVVGAIAFQSGRKDRTSECSIDKPNGSPRRQKPASRMERKGIAPSGKMFEVATSNAGVHFQLEVHFVHRNSTGNKIQRMQHRSLAERDVQQPWRPNHDWELQTATGLLLRRTRHCSCPLRSRVFTEMH